MTRTNVTISLDAGIKEKAMPLIQNKMHSSLSSEVDKMLRRIIKRKGRK